MSGIERDQRPDPDAAKAVNLYCMASMIADEASETGYAEFARALEDALSGFLASLPREAQGAALRLSYEMALGGAGAEPPRLRLVHSRD